MVRAVARALAEEGHLLVQAGTGTGKSLGYLVPAMRWAVDEGAPVLVSIPAFDGHSGEMLSVSGRPQLTSRLIDPRDDGTVLRRDPLQDCGCPWGEGQPHASTCDEHGQDVGAVTAARVRQENEATYCCRLQCHTDQ